MLDKCELFALYEHDLRAHYKDSRRGRQAVSLVVQLSNDLLAAAQEMDLSPSRNKTAGQSRLSGLGTGLRPFRA